MKNIIVFFAVVIYGIGWYITTELLNGFLHPKSREEIDGCYLAGALWPVLWGLLFFVLSIVALFYIVAKVAIKAHKKIKDKIDKIFE